MEKITPDEILRAEGLTKSYGRKLVLDGLSFSIRRGEKVAVIGRSGAGKTTLLGLLGGLEPKSAGKIFFNGKELTRRSLRNYRRRFVGFLFQNGCLIDEFTAAQNVEVSVRLSGSGADVNRYLSLVGLAEEKNAYPNYLSGGQCRRIALARALAKKPDLLLLDEPTEGLDDITGLEIMELVERLCAEYGITVVMVTHRLPFAKRMDRCLRLENGRLCEGDFL